MPRNLLLFFNLLLLIIPLNLYGMKKAPHKKSKSLEFLTFATNCFISSSSGNSPTPTPEFGTITEEKDSFCVSPFEIIKPLDEVNNTDSNPLIEWNKYWIKGHYRTSNPEKYIERLTVLAKNSIKQ